MEERGAADGDREGEEEDREHHPGAGGGVLRASLRSTRWRRNGTGRGSRGTGACDLDWVSEWWDGIPETVCPSTAAGITKGVRVRLPRPPPLGTWGGRGRSVG